MDKETALDRIGLLVNLLTDETLAHVDWNIYSAELTSDRRARLTVCPGTMRQLGQYEERRTDIKFVKLTRTISCVDVAAYETRPVPEGV